MKKEETDLIWKDIKGFEGFYKANSNGEIWRIAKTNCEEFVKKKQIGTGNSGIVALCKQVDGEIVKKHYITKTLIFDTFNDNRSHPIICKNGNESDLSIGNLEEDKSRLYCAPKIYKEDKATTVARMSKLKEGGVSYKKIAKVFGCSDVTVKNYLKGYKNK